jgi:hypothetical protein
MSQKILILFAYPSQHRSTAVDENRIYSHIDQWLLLLKKIKQRYLDNLTTDSITTLNEILGEAI